MIYYDITWWHITLNVTLWYITTLGEDMLRYDILRYDILRHYVRTYYVTICYVMIHYDVTWDTAGRQNTIGIKPPNDKQLNYFQGVQYKTQSHVQALNINIVCQHIIYKNIIDEQYLNSNGRVLLRFSILISLWKKYVHFSDFIWNYSSTKGDETHWNWGPLCMRSVVLSYLYI